MHLVTGGSGYLGSQLARTLLRRGERVRVLDVWDSPERPPEVEFHACNILDREGVRRAMRGVRFVHHDVALVPLTKSGSRFLEVNRDGTQVALDCAREAGVELFVHMSSSAVYGVPPCPITEDTPRRPVEVYGRAKLEAEERVLRAAASGQPCAVVRPRTILGPGRLGIFEILFDWVRDGRAVYVIGSGRERFQFVHVEDLCAVSVRLTETRRTGAFNVGTDRFGTLREDMGALVAHAGTGSRIRSLPAAPAIAALRALDLLGLSPLAPWHYLTYHKPFWFDVARARDELGWVPQHGNRDMLIEAYDWFVAHGTGAHASGGSPHRRSVRRGILELLRRLS
jgi:nucleoside-diphosphate-sugar epimerase